MKIVVKLALCALVAVFALLARAQEQVPEAVAAGIIERLQEARPDMEYGEVRHTPLPGIYQVRVVGGPKLYTDEDASYMVAGELYRIRPGQFVTAADELKAGERRQMLAAVSRDEMIVFSPEGEVRAVVNVFTDIDCGYCRRLHGEVPALNDMGVEVRYLAFPRAGLGSESYRKIATAWCADNPRETLTRLKQGEDIPLDVCDDNPVAEHLELVERLGLSGTPALVLEDGLLVQGYQPADQLAKVLGLR